MILKNHFKLYETTVKKITFTCVRGGRTITEKQIGKGVEGISYGLI
jgi:hypothetical protein